MHPVIKMVSLIILSIFSTQGGWANLFLTISIILPFYYKYPELWSSALKMVLRLKWLFFSILLIYFLLTPEISHLLLALFRILVLISIIFSVNLFLKTSTIEQILASLLWIFHPLNLVKLNVERLSLRAVLTLEYVEVLSQTLEKYNYNKRERPLDKKDHNDKNTIKHFLIQQKDRFFYLIEHWTIIFQDVFSEVLSSQRESNKQYTIECLDAPYGFQLLIPVVLCLIYLFNPLSMMNF
ncbi:MAG: energy-coupling factor transporter transmembrane protein EcfT [gamma proteobacterium symbiont of Taylorina sp.]|nr:energy-coupling factor transporter transmembrane protein EcfT [gamma proteobacterium symbiont of Taylorina sp.]